MKKDKKYSKRLVLIDGHAIIHRAYYALPPMTTKGGEVVNAVYGFTTMLLKVLEDLNPTHIAMSFDVRGKTFRDEMYEEYKANREERDQELYDQIPISEKVAQAFDIPVYKKEGYEADDIIGTVAKHIDDLDGEDTEVIIVTGDKDILQLVDDRVKVALTKKGITNMEMYDIEAVEGEFGFGPETVVDYKALRGDSSDNIPGVSGIGDKRAKSLLDKIGDVDEIYEQLQDEGSILYEEFTDHIINKLKEGKDGVELSRKLAKIKTDVEDLDIKLENCEAHEFDHKKIKDLFTRLEFFSLLKRIPGVERDPGAKRREKLEQLKDIESVESGEDIKELKEKIDEHEVFSCRQLLSGKDVISSDLVGLIFVVSDQPFWLELDKLTEKQQQDLFKIFTKKDYQLVGHNIKELLKALQLLGVETNNKLFDTQIASYLINSSASDHDLDSIIMREMQLELKEETNQGSLFEFNPDKQAQDAFLILQLKDIFEEKLQEVDEQNVFENIEAPLLPVLAKMELNGVAVDEDMFDQLSQEVTKKISDLVKEIHELAGEEFNVNSTKQLREVLYDKLELPTDNIKEGKTGYSTAASELEKLRDEHPIIELIEEHRELEKLRNTYIDVFPTLINEETGRIHTSFNQTVTTTGRLSSSDPNLQNIPVRTELGKRIRDAFVATDDNKLIAADYSQIELRIVAHLSGDEKLIDIFSKDKDVHTATAATIFDVKQDEVEPHMRSKAKEVNFGVLYGMGPYGLARRTDISRAEAKEFIDKYFERFSGVKRFVDKTIEFAKDRGYAETMFGRRRHLPELNSDNYHMRRSGERMAINMPVQGTQADIIKKAMIEIDEKIEDEYGDDLKMLLQVHDELVFETSPDGLEEKTKMITETMEDIIELAVPVKVDVNVGKRWGKLK